MAVAHREILAAMPTSELPGEGVVRLDGLHVVEEREDAIRQTAEQLVPEFHRGWLNSTRGEALRVGARCNTSFGGQGY